MENNKKIDFYGGNIGQWVPLSLLIIGMITVVIFNKTDFYVYTFCLLSLW